MGDIPFKWQRGVRVLGRKMLLKQEKCTFGDLWRRRKRFEGMEFSE